MIKRTANGILATALVLAGCKPTYVINNLEGQLACSTDSGPHVTQTTIPLNDQEGFAAYLDEASRLIAYGNNNWGIEGDSNNSLLIQGVPIELDLSTGWLQGYITLEANKNGKYDALVEVECRGNNGLER